MDLKNKRVVITGAGSGIGKELVLALQKKEGIRILAYDLNPESIPKAANTIPLAADVSDKKEIQKMIRTAKQKLGGIDVFFANAGFAYYEKIRKPSWKRIQSIYKTNVFSPIYSLLLLNQENDSPFFFVITASAMSHFAIPGYALYSGTKAAVHNFAEGYRYELKPGNHLMLVYPIATRTNFFAKAGEKVRVPFPSQTPKRVAKAILFGVRWNFKRVYPSKLFSLLKFLDRFLFYPMKLYQWVEKHELKKL